MGNNNYALSTAFVVLPCATLWQDAGRWKGIIRILMGGFYESVVASLWLLMSGYEWYRDNAVYKVGGVGQALQHMVYQRTSFPLYCLLFTPPHWPALSLPFFLF